MEETTLQEEKTPQNDPDSVWIPFEEVEKFVMSIKDMMQSVVDSIDNTMNTVKNEIANNQGDNNDGN